MPSAELEAALVDAFAHCKAPTDVGRKVQKHWGCPSFPPALMLRHQLLPTSCCCPPAAVQPTCTQGPDYFEELGPDGEEEEPDTGNEGAPCSRWGS